LRKLCTYILTNDTGLAPNPFWGWCTLAVCTPNRQGAILGEGDWIAGFLTKDRGHRLLYAMQVSNRIHIHAYFEDPRFQAKKPNLRGNWKDRCGDNFYSQHPDGFWQQHRNRFHLGSEYLAKDTRRPFVFVSQKYWYFGRNAVVLPHELVPLIGGRGIRVRHAAGLAEQFFEWLQLKFEPGISGLPIDNPEITETQAIYTDQLRGALECEVD
jgi:Nucleotide modification associated domain 2